MTCAKQYERISGDWVRYFNRLNRKDTRPLLTTEIMIAQLEKQNGLCALSGVELTCQLQQGVRFTRNASIDRIEAGAEYTPDNIQLVCSALNRWRSDTALDEFIWFCKQIAEYHTKDKYALDAHGQWQERTLVRKGEPAVQQQAGTTEESQ